MKPNWPFTNALGISKGSVGQKHTQSRNPTHFLLWASQPSLWEQKERNSTQQKGSKEDRLSSTVNWYTFYVDAPQYIERIKKEEKERWVVCKKTKVEIITSLFFRSSLIAVLIIFLSSKSLQSSSCKTKQTPPQTDHNNNQDNNKATYCTSILPRILKIIIKLISGTCLQEHHASVCHNTSLIHFLLLIFVYNSKRNKVPFCPGSPRPQSPAASLRSAYHFAPHFWWRSWMSRSEAQGRHGTPRSQIHPQEIWAPSPSVCAGG